MRRTLLIVTVFLFAILFESVPAHADEYRPAYLELNQTTPEIFRMLWKVPAKGKGQRLALYVTLPDDVTVIGQERSAFVGGAFVSHSTIKRIGGLTGIEITIAGLERVSTDVLVRIQGLDGSKEVVRLTPAEPSFFVAGTPTGIDVAKTYLAFGVEHILEGIDHLLFVACLLFIAGTWRRILITITGFTLAHSITLTLAALGFVRVPVPPVEAVIALSIVFLAREIAHHRRDTLTWRYPIAVSVIFGLLHGFGFASALRDIGLPPTEIPAALLAFNVGVEIGQVIFVAFILAVVWMVTFGLDRIALIPSGEHSQPAQVRSGHWLRVFEKPMAYSIGGITMLWTVERIMVFWL